LIQEYVAIALIKRYQWFFAIKIDYLAAEELPALLYDVLSVFNQLLTGDK